MTLLEQGDEERALIELLNVLKYAPFHQEALRTYADIRLRQGKSAEAYRYYARLIDRYPDTADVRLVMAGMAVRDGNWEEAERHGKALAELAPDDLKTRAIGKALAYHEATLRRDEEARAEIAQEALALLEELRTKADSYDDGLLRIVIDQRATGAEPASALPVLETALEHDPGALDLNMLKLRLLANAGETEAAGALLLRMVELFPNNTDIQNALVSWYVSEKDFDAAEALLRRMAGADEAVIDGHIRVVQFLQSTRGRDAARAELERLQAVNEGSGLGRAYGAMLAAMAFEDDRPADAIAGMRAVIDGAAPGSQTRDHKVLLAKMQARTGDGPGARAEVDAVLGEDPGHAGALKMRADWLIDEDRTQEAILALRTALRQNPEDVEALTLMARAHERDGDRVLLGERLSMAVQASQGAPREAMRYARFLVGEGQGAKAADLLEAVRKGAPGNLDVLLLLANVYLTDRAWPEAREIAKAMDGIGTVPAGQAALTLRTAIMQGQDQTDESLALLEDETAARDPQAARSTILTVETLIRDGRLDEARAKLDAALSETPDAAPLLLLDAGLNARMGNLAQAEDGYRALIATHPQDDTPVRELMAMLAAAGRGDEMRRVLAAGLERNPASVELLGLKASLLEADGKIPEAIEVLEAVYAGDSRNVFVANNLASLLSTHGTTPESLERAHAIAKRLRGSEVPAFRDTYGWIAYQRGNYETAVEYLASAAEALPEEPVVQFHLGMALAKSGRDDEARVALTRALELGGSMPQLDEARETLTSLDGTRAGE